jgi:hypothetical protein
MCSGDKILAVSCGVADHGLFVASYYVRRVKPSAFILDLSCPCNVNSCSVYMSQDFDRDTYMLEAWLRLTLTLGAQCVGLHTLWPLDVPFST